jgi:hypothetical protein
MAVTSSLFTRRSGKLEPTDRPGILWQYIHDLPEVLRRPALAAISHKLGTATANAAALTGFRSVDLLDILHEYDCGGLGHKPCQSGAFTVLLRQPLKRGN